MGVFFSHVRCLIETRGIPNEGKQKKTVNQVCFTTNMSHCNIEEDIVLPYALIKYLSPRPNALVDSSNYCLDRSTILHS